MLIWKAFPKSNVLIWKTFFKDSIYFYREGKGGRKRGKYQRVVASHAPPSGNLVCNLGMYPDWELNWQPFGLQASTQSTEPHKPGLDLKILYHKNF